MNFKKIAISAASGAVMLSAAMPAGAFYFPGFGGSDELTVKVYNDAFVKNEVTTKANTGDNEIHGKVVFGGRINTGDATAYGEVNNLVNTNVIDLCGCLLEGMDDVEVKVSNDAFVKNDVYTKANTGDNEIGGKYVFGGKISTGGAGAASVVGNVVNSNVVGNVE